MQQTLFDTKKYTKFELPDYPKRYSPYIYDKEAYHKYYKEVIKANAIKENNPDNYLKVRPYDIIHKFILRNKDGSLKKDKDEVHIFRINILHKIYEELACEVLNGQQIIPFDSCSLNFYGVEVFLDSYDDKPYEYYSKRSGCRKYRGDNFISVSAQLADTWRLPIYKRVKIHLMLLKELRNGATIKQAVYKVKRKFKKWQTV